MRRQGYDVALICLNGHVVNGSYINFPEQNAKHCSTCGEKAINACPSCNAEIRGSYWGGFGVHDYERPAFCGECGSAYPWTDRHLKAAHELASTLPQLPEVEVQQLQIDLESLVKSAPETPAAAARFKRVLAKVGQGTAQAFRDILVDVVSETAKKAIWG